MNKSDFISDAVALDLGKSGVKVAETLEMQIGDEWWRLINSAEPMTTKSFIKRMERGVDIEEGEMDVSPISSVFTSVGGGTYFAQDKNTCSILARVKQGDGGTDLTRLIVMYRSKDNTVPDQIRASMYQSDGSLVKTYIGNTYTSNFSKTVAFWDYINQQAILVFYVNSYDSGNKIFYVSPTGTNVLSSGYLTLTPVLETEIKSFMEVPEKIYSLFRKTEGIFIKQSIPTVGATAQAVANIVFSTTGATVISVASNYRNNEAFLFYSRTHESAGVAWVDKTNGKLYYAVESDNWSTAYELSATFSGDNSTLRYFGNMVLGGDAGGEYYIAGRDNYRTGNFSKPTGFSFPVNLEVMGIATSTAGFVRIFGRIGTVLYIYLVDLGTMTILSENSYDTGNTISGNFQPVKIGESATRELYCLNYCATNTSTTQVKALLVNVDKSTNNILWVWGYGGAGWANTTTWDVIREPWYQMIRKYKNDLAFISITRYNYNSNDGRITYRFIPSSNVIECSTLDDLTTLIISFTKQQTIVPNNYFRYGQRSVTPQNVLTYGETVDTFFFADYSNDNNASYPNSMHFDKITKQFTNYYIGADTGGGSPLKQMCGASYSEQYDSYMYNAANGTSDEVGSVQTLANAFVKYNPAMTQLESYSFFTTTNLFYNYIYFVIPKVNNIMQLYAHIPTSNILNCFIFDLGASGGHTLYNRALTLSHNAYRVMVGTKYNENMLLVISNCVNGEIAYTQLKAEEGIYKEALAIKATDFTKSYSLNLGRTPIGGEHSVSPSGSWLLSRDYANRVVLADTGTTLTDYMGGEAPAQSSSIIYLYENLNYIPYPFAREGIKVELSNISKMTKVTIPETQTDLIRTMIASGTDFRGSRCILRRLFPDHTEKGSDIILLDGYIQDWSYSPDKKGILFTVSKTLIDVGATFPKRLMNMGCSHVFKGVRCGYLGADGICTKTKTDCTSKGAVNNFGGFPWVAARQRRIMWR